MKRKFEGIWIPVNIWENSKLSPTDRCLLAEINSLDNPDTGCYASNLHFSKFFGISESTIKRSISKLESIGLIEVSYSRTNRGVKRIIHSSEDFGQVKMTRADRSNRPVRTGQNDLYNNIDINNIDLYSDSAKSDKTKVPFGNIPKGLLYDLVKRKIAASGFLTEIQDRIDFKFYYEALKSKGEGEEKTIRSWVLWFVNTLISDYRRDNIRLTKEKSIHPKSTVANQYDELRA